MPRTYRHIAAAAALALLGSAASAAPFALMQPTNAIASADLPGVSPDPGYTVTFIVDNGGTSAANQVWQAQHLTCVIFRFNQAQDAVYRQSLPGTALATQGQAASDASGFLSGMFESIAGTGSAGDFAGSAGLPTLTAPVAWIAEHGHPDVLVNGDGTRVAGTTSVIMVPGYWGPARRVAGPCDDTPYTAPPTAVPTLGHGALALLGASLAGLAAWRRRRGGV